MSRYGTILGGTANARSFVVQASEADVLQTLIGTAVSDFFNSGIFPDPVITSVNLTGAGDGYMFFVEVELADASNVDGGADIRASDFFLAATADVLVMAQATAPNTMPILDVQLAGASKGQRVMGIVLFGTLRGGGGAFEMFSRVDCSVNAAYVESPYSRTPVLHTRSSGQVAGGYNGGGIGNKSILGFRVGNGLPLGQLQSIEYTWLDLNPAMSGFATYANLIIDVYGNGTDYKIAVIDPASSPVVNNGTTVLNPDGSRTTTWLAASNNVLIVNGLSAAVPAPGPPYVPPDVQGAAPPTYGFTGGWPSSSYKLSTILAAYPNAKLAEASSGDGGLPRAPNKTPAFLLVTGDSANQIIRAFLLSNVKFNGAVV